MAESVDDTNTADVTRDGPLEMSGEIAVSSAGGEILQEAKRTWLCRCGASSNKPFCDGSHSKVGFKDGGDLAEANSKPDAYAPGGKLTVTPLANGPLLLKGSLEIRSADGKVISYHAGQAALCRCGRSGKKPFCDGTHKQVGFSAD
ncbi:MAG: CDGSH iron-sulfur domain-containing protein [Gemmatimonadales bacterium]|jgi:CDGSH-type Zn-finger protein